MKLKVHPPLPSSSSPPISSHSQDKNDTMNKQGCGRVVACKEFGLIHSYTLECGYHSVTQLKPLVNLKKHHVGTQ